MWPNQQILNGKLHFLCSVTEGILNGKLYFLCSATTRDHPFSTYQNPRKIFYPDRYTYACVSWSKIFLELVFRKFCIRTRLMIPNSSYHLSGHPQLISAIWDANLIWYKCCNQSLIALMHTSSLFSVWPTMEWSDTIS